MNNIIENAAKKILQGGQINRPETDAVNTASHSDLMDMLYWANKIRVNFFGNRIKLCSIVPGRVGGCDQDCAYCAQSARYKTHITRTKTYSDEEILSAAEQASKNGVPHIGIVYSGRAIKGTEFERLIRLVKEIKSKYNINVCAGLGILGESEMKQLAEAGVSRYNHNLETSRRYYPEIVTTHTYDDRVATVNAAKKAGLGLCTGGIFGIGENDSDRIDMAFDLRALEVDTVNLNFLLQIEGTPLAKTPPLQPFEILRITALYRFILPQAQLKVAGGRTAHLRDLQSWVFSAGATSIMTGNYLTTAGRDTNEDLQMLKDLGLEPWKDE